MNGEQVEAYRDTGASVTLVAEALVRPEQYLPGQMYQVVNADNITKRHPMAVVDFEWEGVTGPKQVAVSSALPVEVLLGNDLEKSKWAEVEFRTHSAMLGEKAHALMTTRSQALIQSKEETLEPGIMAQELPKKGRRGKKGIYSS